LRGARLCLNSGLNIYLFAPFFSPESSPFRNPIPAKKSPFVYLQFFSYYEDQFETQISVKARVTRLGEILPIPIGRLFTLKEFLSRSRILAAFFHEISYVLILPENGLGYILGDFFKNSSIRSPWTQSNDYDLQRQRCEFLQLYG
jgi:hypothetical protein